MNRGPLRQSLFDGLMVEEQEKEEDVVEN